jgi:hypothetical protein
MSGYTTELVFCGLITTWILYELYGRNALEWISHWTMYIRIVGGIAILGYLYWQARDAPEQFQDTLGLAKQVLTTVSGGSTTKEKRNVTGLMKKRVAARQEWKCGTCKKTFDETYEIDHIVPLYKGGSNDENNLIGLCPHCHRIKTVDERIADSQ